MDSLFNLSKKEIHRRSLQSFDIFNNVNENWAATLATSLPIKILRELEKESRMILCELTMCYLMGPIRREQNGWDHGSNCGVVDPSLSRGQLTQSYLRTLQILNIRRQCGRF